MIALARQPSATSSEMGPLMIRMAYMPEYIGEIWNVTPVNSRTDGKWKEEQYSAWVESAINLEWPRSMPLQLLSWIELEICWKYQFPAKKRQNRLKILMEKPFQPSVTDVYSEIG